MIVILTNERWGQDLRPSYNQTPRQADKGSALVPLPAQKRQQDKSEGSHAPPTYQKRKRSYEIKQKDSSLE